ncbi:hypothetical protein C0389_06725 [bacterium]|nr:hypothetical protein [bacterium]
MRFSKYNHEVQTENGNFIICNSLTGAILKIDESHYTSINETLQNKNFVVDQENSIHKNLISSGILVEDTHDESLKALYLSNYALFKNDYLDLRLLPTEDCNCRCTYCYESFEKKEMSSDTRNRLIRLLEKKAPLLKTLNIGWFGGEPLMAMKTIGELSKAILELKEKYGFEYRNHLTTNGFFLTPKNVDKLISFNINNIQVTLDGYGEEHDERKKLKNGGGTFETIFRNLEYLSKSQHVYRLSVRVNFDAGNVNSVKILIAELKKIFWDKKNFEIFFRPTSNWGGQNELGKFELIKKEDSAKYQKEFLNLFYGEIIKYYEFPRLNSLICYASLPNCYIVGSDATLYKCTVHFSSEKNNVGHIDENGNIKIDVSKNSQWISAGDNDKNCLDCKLLPACRGKSCPAAKVVFNYVKCHPAKEEIFEALNEYENKTKITV